jgi:hypothetical protein
VNRKTEEDSFEIVTKDRYVPLSVCLFYSLNLSSWIWVWRLSVSVSVSVSVFVLFDFWIWILVQDSVCSVSALDLDSILI